ncbi:MAG TPA: biopolymer transporter ExbD [Rhizomicrobium sp.]|jgi:biopolymer transport protein ExbD|nr:biopolymer transporter ExbD [Rhizomicrobium sp.]
MAMNVGQGGGDDEVMVEMNTTPLIDVMLVLLVMLIITIPIQTHAVKLNMPNPNSPPPTVQPVVHTLGIDFDGTISWDGKTIPNLRALDPYFTEIAQQENQDEIHVSPNRLAKYDTVAKVLAEASRIGVKKIGFTGEEQYMQ